MQWGTRPRPPHNPLAAAAAAHETMRQNRLFKEAPRNVQGGTDFFPLAPAPSRRPAAAAAPAQNNAA